MGQILLLEAGFSRNWGGWLASEAFEYLLGCPHVDADIRSLLWHYNRRGGFEEALAHLQQEFARKRNSQTEQRLTKLQDAILQMFKQMDEAFVAMRDFDPQNAKPYTIAGFLVRFDAIFTLNQDLLLERQYFQNGNVSLSSYREWTGWQYPGMREISARTQWSPRSRSEFRVEKYRQPYFKLHGSSHWTDGDSDKQLLVMGGNKATSIQQHPILKWN